MNKTYVDGVDANEIDSLQKKSSQLVELFIQYGAINRNKLPKLMAEIYAILVQDPRHETMNEIPQPAVPVENSVTPDYIICLEDGKKLKLLKRHLKAFYNLTPDEYKERWGLPPEYPTVAPNYAKHRSRIAKAMGLGFLKSDRHHLKKNFEPLAAVGEKGMRADPYRSAEIIGRGISYS